MEETQISTCELEPIESLIEYQERTVCSKQIKKEVMILKMYYRDKRDGFPASSLSEAVYRRVFRRGYVDFKIPKVPDFLMYSSKDDMIYSVEDDDNDDDEDDDYDNEDDEQQASEHDSNLMEKQLLLKFFEEGAMFATNLSDLMVSRIREALWAIHTHFPNLPKSIRFLETDISLSRFN
ncbi:hypothetical protein PHJA_001250900 [Phtheirospermum japonicum]|uniref:Uncharacterized protein n=1 Tax=Phtheirospermum japonicum TaxID=374723 RepID=A0A830BXA4_9LAMI|nr:hypothetical protein PHJA_001250900 [Phtheirospermum japonicum]